MKTYYICDSCNKPVFFDELNIIEGDERIKREKQFYCPACFPSITKEIIEEKHKEFVSRKRNNEKKAATDGLFVRGRRKV